MKTHETNLPTQQNTPQKDARLPRPHENCRGTQGDQPSPQSRSKKISRLKTRSEFHRVSVEGKRHVGRTLCLDVRPAPELKFGISASKRYGSAPARNRFKRLVREAVRLGSLPPCEFNAIPRQGAKRARLSDVADELARLLK
jgi:ribonuclease P protein component